jgi:hypothetical protein
MHLAEHVGEADARRNARQVELEQRLHRATPAVDVRRRLERSTMDTPAGVLSALVVGPADPILVAVRPRRNPTRRDGAVVVDEAASHDRDSVGEAANCRVQPRQRVRNEFVVAVHDHDPLPSGVARAGMTRRVDATIRVVNDHAHARVVVCPKHLDRAVVGRIVDHDQLVVVE